MRLLVGLLVDAAATQPPEPLLRDLALKLVTSLPSSALGACGQRMRACLAGSEHTPITSHSCCHLSHHTARTTFKGP